MGNQWPPYNLKALKNGLDSLADGVKNQPKERTDDEQMWLTRFLVVRICGYLEQVVHETLREFIEAKSGGLARTFALSWIEKSRNPSPDNMVGLVGRLDATLGESLQALLDADDKDVLRELSLLLDRRHKIAHGLNEGMNTRKALALKEVVEKVAEWFFSNLDPTIGRK
ncbi:HEPN domain-containing protein [Actinokineospora spheciospongiae]|uniref:HEPN domain-containing protein n=1 Tax=Actinokineospora spheciospongiae TaxID=909613 RepID=UPI0012687C78|nr:HEPN domain-containing protein [Actinokineospora spheciospongiae]